MFNLFKKKPKVSLTPEQLKLNEEISSAYNKACFQYAIAEGEIEDKVDEYRDQLYNDPNLVSKREECYAEIKKLVDSCPHLVTSEYYWNKHTPPYIQCLVCRSKI